MHGHELADLQLKGAGAQLSTERHVWSAGQSTKKGLGRAEGRKERQHRAGMNIILDVASAGICRFITVRVRLTTLA